MPKISREFLIPCGISAITYVASLPFPGIYAKNWAGAEKFLSGLEVLEVSWLGLLQGNFAWFVNVIFVIGIIRLLFGLTAKNSVLFAIAIALGSTSFLLKEVCYNEGNPSPVTGLGPLILALVISIRIGNRSN